MMLLTREGGRDDVSKCRGGDEQRRRRARVLLRQRRGKGGGLGSRDCNEESDAWQSRQTWAKALAHADADACVALDETLAWIRRHHV